MKINYIIPLIDESDELSACFYEHVPVNWVPWLLVTLPRHVKFSMLMLGEILQRCPHDYFPVS